MPSQPTVNQRARAWCFTLNNYDENAECQLRRLNCQYLVYGREIGTSGTPHLQGYVYFTHNKTRSATKAVLPGNPHLEMRLGSHTQASVYCKKDGDFIERGEPPLDFKDIQAKGQQASAAKWKDIRDKAIAGDISYIEQHHPKEFILYKPRLESLYAPRNTPMDGDLLHEWWVGPSGSGKSKALWDLYPDHFAKSINKWWDGYRHEQVVAIEEWSPDNTLTAQALKRWADRYPFTGEIKGGTMTRLRPRKIIILSNYTLEQCFPRPEDLQPLQRRFKLINFPDGVQHATFRAAWFNEPALPSPTPSSVDMEEPMDMDLPFLDLDGLFSQE